MDGNGAITSTVYARIGLLGNPSDGFNGKTISLSLRNFSAEVTLISADVITFEPHPEHDLTEFSSLSDLHHRVSRHGFYGGKRLLMAACKSFYSLCQQQGIALDDSRAFRMRYRTNIPRQAGLSGSSALVVAALNCLMRFYGVEEHVAFQDRPTLALAAERELGITAGLQDRVIQVYGGVVHMNFEESHMAQHGRGRYERLPCSCLPPLWLVYADCPSDSGAVHSDVRMRWERGDAEVREGMLRIASMAERGREALLAGDLRELAECMNANFDERRRMYGDAVLGDTNLRMVVAARAVGAAAKFCGSGGAVVVLCPDGEEQALRLQEKCREQGFVVVKVEVAPPNPGTETSMV